MGNPYANAIAATLDHKGRIFMPEDLREATGLKEGDALCINYRPINNKSLFIVMKQADVTEGSFANTPIITLDHKGRIPIPKDLQAAADLKEGDGLYISCGASEGKILFVIVKQDEIIEDSFIGAAILTLDDRGRILIPKDLREVADLKKGDELRINCQKVDEGILFILVKQETQ